MGKFEYEYDTELQRWVFLYTNKLPDNKIYKSTYATNDLVELIRWVNMVISDPVNVINIPGGT